MRFLRRLYRIPALVIWLVWQGIISQPISHQKDKKKAVRDMAEQTRSWGAGLLKIFGVELIPHGDMTPYKNHGGLVVSNHLGYLDIFVHATLFGLRFTPKKEIRSWPFFGWYTDITHPIWVDRNSRQKSQELLEEFRETLRDNVPLIVYPEGTSTDGKSGLLPFKATPFETVVKTSIAVQPVLTIYHVEGNDVSPCWYGDMELLPHVWALLGNRKVRAEVYILPLVQAENMDRKALAEHVHTILLNAYTEIMAKAIKTE